MSTAVSPITVEEFLALPEDQTVRRELIGGEAIEMAYAGQPHEIVKSNFFHKLGAFFDRNPIGRVMGETAYRLTPHDCPMPDVSMILGNRFTPGHTGLIAFAPDLAIEVISSEPAAVLHAKIKLYLSHGVRAIWVAYPELRIIYVHDATGVRELSGEQRLEAPDLLSGFSEPVSAFFEGL